MSHAIHTGTCRAEQQAAERERQRRAVLRDPTPLQRLARRIRRLGRVVAEHDAALAAKSREGVHR